MKQEVTSLPALVDLVYGITKDNCSQIVWRRSSVASRLFVADFSTYTIHLARSDSAIMFFLKDKYTQCVIEEMEETVVRRGAITRWILAAVPRRVLEKLYDLCEERYGGRRDHSLPPCPACASTQVKYGYIDGYGRKPPKNWDWWVIRCDNCLYHSRACHTKDEALSDWRDTQL